MKANIGDFDCIVRVLVGLVMLAAYIAWPELPGRSFLVVGIWPILTAAFFHCPIYALAGHTTRAPQRGGCRQS